MSKMRLLPISDDEEKAINRGIALDPNTVVLTDALLAILRPRHRVLAEQARDKGVGTFGDACSMSPA